MDQVPTPFRFSFSLRSLNNSCCHTHGGLRRVPLSWRRLKWKEQNKTTALVAPQCSLETPRTPQKDFIVLTRSGGGGGKQAWCKYCQHAEAGSTCSQRGVGCPGPEALCHPCGILQNPWFPPFTCTILASTPGASSPRHLDPLGQHTCWPSQGRPSWGSDNWEITSSFQWQPYGREADKGPNRITFSAGYDDFNFHMTREMHEEE